MPEIARVDLSGAMLQLLCWGEPDPAGFPWFEPPPREMIDRGLALLRQLGATDESGLTEIGRRMGRLPVEPRIARLLCEGLALGHPQRIALVGALLSERDPFYGSGDFGRAVRRAALVEFRRAGSSCGRGRISRGQERDRNLGSLDAGAVQFLLRARDQLLRECIGDKNESGDAQQSPSMR